MNRLILALKALRELGPGTLGQYALYQLGLRTGYYRWLTSSRPADDRVRKPVQFHPVLKLPDREMLTGILGEAGCAQLLAEADEIVEGKVRLFGGQPVPLQLMSSDRLAHWTVYARAGEGEQDVKFIWEPGRFGWAYTLGRAYHLSGDERYPEAFWRYFDTFLGANPPYQGLNWVSAQEVALRLAAFVFAGQVFSRSPYTTPQRISCLVQAIADHARRIPPTLVYARAQNNNHLLSEAAGLYTASLALPDHPAAPGWRALGWREFHRALQSQIAEDGAYVQHSANYQRLMLQLASWVHALADGKGESFPEKSRQLLSAATRWLLALLDPISGCLPDLGPNDGAYFLPYTVLPHQDYRPVLQAAAAIFLGERLLESGPWDEMPLWLGQTSQLPGSCHSRRGILRSPCCVLYKDDSWAYLRLANFISRPGHADQLHLDLWWRGLNVAQDAGTYLYNAPPPWDNALARTDVHNTLTVNGLDQMRRAGRFLYLDWAQASVISPPGDSSGMTACHDGYRSLGLRHQRSVAPSQDGWLIEDELLPVNSVLAGRHSPFSVSLHWLLPDWPYEILEMGNKASGKANSMGYTLRFSSPHGWVRLVLSASQPCNLQITRAGELVYGEGDVRPVWGWSSPTYGVKIPALSVRLNSSAIPPLKLTSQFDFPAAAGAGESSG